MSEIHLITFKDFFLTSLGEGFLSTYYKSCIKSDESIVICAIDENEKLIGFSVGCLYSKGFHKRLIKQNLVAFMVQALIILFSKPKAIIRLLNNLGKNADKNDNGNYAELLSIGVLPDYNGQGIGKELIKRFEEEAMNKGCSEMALTTDFDQNSKRQQLSSNCAVKFRYSSLDLSLHHKSLLEELKCFQEMAIFTA